MKRFIRLFLSGLIVIAGSPLFAQDPAADAPVLSAQAAVLLDAATGTLLYNKNGDDSIPPASLTKLMTLHIALSEVAAGRAEPDEIVPLSRESWAINQPPRSSLMFLAAGQTVTLRELLLGLAIPSGNDAAVAVALRFAPSVDEFVDRMNQEARRMGMKETSFVEPSGISEYNLTTALEFARFCREYLRFHPETLAELHSVREFAYPKVENVGERYRDRPGTIVQSNHNTLLIEGFEGVDGVKTGYIDEAGYNIALTAERQGTRLIAIVLGASSTRTRDDDGRRLLTWGFEHFKTLRPVTPPLEPVPVWKGKTDTVKLIPVEGEETGDNRFAVEFTAFTDRSEGLRWETIVDDPLIAPLPAGTAVGDMVLYDDAGELRRITLVTAETVEPGGFFKRLWHSIGLFFRDAFH
jgi:D-alanyl-D-alanine carboxypeptidase (penicillin-binding protein 5/6)